MIYKTQLQVQFRANNRIVQEMKHDVFAFTDAEMLPNSREVTKTANEIIKSHGGYKFE